MVLRMKVLPFIWTMIMMDMEIQRLLRKFATLLGTYLFQMIATISILQSIPLNYITLMKILIVMDPLQQLLFVNLLLQQDIQLIQQIVMI